MATPMHQGVNGVGATPGRPGQTPMRTPRDAYALNDDDGSFNVSATPRDIRMREHALKHQLKSGLASLPKPKDTEWEFEIPDEQQEPTRADGLTEEDAAERDRRQRERRAAEEALELRRRTQVMQRELPRPLVVDLPTMLKKAEAISNPAEALVAKEAAALVASDAVKYPLPGSQVKGKPRTLPAIDDNSLANARLLILSETKSLPSFEEVQAAFENRANNSTLLGLGCYSDDEEEQKAAMRQAFDVSLTPLTNYPRYRSNANPSTGCPRFHHVLCGAGCQAGEEAGTASRRLPEAAEDAAGQDGRRGRGAGEGSQCAERVQDVGHLGRRGHQ